MFADSYNDRGFKGFSIFDVKNSGAIESRTKDVTVNLSGSDNAVAICFAGDRRIFSAHANDSIQMWTVEDEVRGRYAPFRGFRKPTALSASKSNELLVAGNKFGELCIWKFEKGKIPDSGANELRKLLLKKANRDLTSEELRIYFPD